MGYLKSRLVRFSLGGALLLWIGALGVAIVNYEPPAEPERSAGAGPALTDNAPSRVARQTPDRMAIKRRQAPPAVAAPTIANNKDEPRAPRAQPNSQPGFRGEDNAETADVAPLETTSRAEVDASRNRVARAQFTTGIIGQEPINRIETVISMNGEVFSADGKAVRALYYFTEVEGMRGETVVHRWERGGEVVAEAAFNVHSDSGRVFSRQDLQPAMEGDWRVVVTDASGNVIKTDTLLYQSF